LENKGTIGDGICFVMKKAEKVKLAKNDKRKRVKTFDVFK
jgi:hypothetical protein